MVKGEGNDEFTPDIVLKILKNNRLYSPQAKPYRALGDGMLQLNFAKAYYGFYSNNLGDSVPYIVKIF